MKRSLLWLLALFLGVSAFAQKPNSNNTLLWRISGNGLKQPSYLFGTIHMLCSDDIQLSDSLKGAISRSDRIYLELDMDNMLEMFSVVNKMKMNGDTTLADLLTEEEYAKVKDFFSSHRGLIPFSMLETYKPMLAASTMMQSSIDCDNPIAMEQLVMQEAKKVRKKIRGLETMAFQISIFDSIPYQLQAKQLVKYVEDFGKKDDKSFEQLSEAYRNQELSKLEQLTMQEDAGIEKFTEILLYNRNVDWVDKMSKLMGEESLVVAVGAGHLPGERGVINLLRKAGYKVEPVRNDMIRKKVKEI
jgi:uncharacterized protein YbaP (TraB family)